MISLKKAIITAFIVLALLLFRIYLRPVQVTELYNIPFPTLQKSVKIGGVIEYKVLYCRPNNYITQTTRYVVDIPSGKRVKTNETVSNMSQTFPDCTKDTPTQAIVKVQIPEVETTGGKQILIESTYLINQRRSIKKESWTQPFTVE